MKTRRVPYVLDFMMWEWSVENRRSHPQLTTGATTIIMAGGIRTNSNHQAISFRVAHFGRAAEPERINRLIEVTKEFVARRS